MADPLMAHGTREGRRIGINAPPTATCDARANDMTGMTFLTYESPWPAYSGARKRVWGILSQLGQEFALDVGVLSKETLSEEQRSQLAPYCTSLHRIPRRDKRLPDILHILGKALAQRIPYHAALIEHSRLAAGPQRPYHHLVYANLIHWTVPLLGETNQRWIVDQQNADVHFWDLYAQEATSPAIRAFARINRSLTASFCRKMYPEATRIVSVSEHDEELTRRVSPSCRTSVIENGVDCDYFAPATRPARSRQVLFTGTSVQRNLVALRRFVRDVWPAVIQTCPDVTLLVGGNFGEASMQEFKGVGNMRFTGKVPDLRPCYDESLIFVNPFDEIYGSKLKVSEAMAMGLCVVSYTNGVRGMPLRDRESVLLASDAAQLIERIRWALAHKEEVKAIGARGRTVALRTLDWSRVLGPRLRDLVREVVSDLRRTELD